MPIYSGDSLRLSGAEVLIRCAAPELEAIGPDIFIPIAEEYGLIREIDAWVIDAALKTIAQAAPIINQYQLNICINISALELVNPQFPALVKQLLQRYKINPQCIELELTETSLIDVDEQSIALLAELKALGVTLSLDDFGTGYTAFNQLLSYPVDCLKIDRSFIEALDSDSDKATAMVDAILAIAQSYNLNVIAEGVESDKQYQYLCKKNCGFVQGYLMSKPIAWAEFKLMLEQLPIRSRLGVL